MLHLKYFLSPLLVITLIIGVSACSTPPANLNTQASSQAASPVSSTHTPSSAQPSKATPPQKNTNNPLNKTLIKVNQELDALFTPEVGLF